MDAIRRIFRTLFRIAIVWLVDALSLLITAAIVPGVSIEPVGQTSRFAVAAAAALMLGIVNFLIRPLILLLALPLGFFVLFAAGFIINIIVLLIASSLMPGFEVHGLVPALLGSVVLSIVNTLVTAIVDVDDDSFYSSRVERLAKRQEFAASADDTTGLLIIEIDGLSYHHMRKALADGYMPTLKQMMEEEGYVLDRVDCGLPSMTSAAQAGILFGDNYDIPAFRWYDKRRQKLFVSTTDAPELNARYSTGAGLLRGGSSINNMFTGDAEKSLFTLANLRSGSAEERRRRAGDAYLLMVNPYFFMRTLVLYLGDVILELWQAAKQALKNEQPRLNRLKHGYPFVRAATTVFMRDIPLYFVSLDVVRGSPAIYYTFVGYDEVAHHSGTWSSDAFNVLRQLDRAISYLKDLIERKAPRPYELVLLSDHGQSFGATFKMRYGLTLKEFIEQHLPQGARVTQAIGGDGGAMSVDALTGELENMQDQAVGGKVGQTTIKQAQKLIKKSVEAERVERAHGEEEAEQHSVVAYGSGNLAQVYFNVRPHKLTLSELNATYPGMVDALVNHEGIGLVAGYDDEGTPVALGKGGMRNLHTGQVTGADPLALYADERASADFRAEQVRRVMDFPNAGDLMVISTVYPDGTVAALEELIGSHGGLGGEQTDAFIFHPASWGKIPQTKCTTDVFRILNARRNQPAQPMHLRCKAQPAGVRDWAPATLRAGLSRVGKWLGLAGRCAVMDRLAYRRVAFDPFMTGPAVLIGLIGTLIITIFSAPGAFDLNSLLIAFPLRVVSWLLDTLVVFGAARVLGSRASYTANLRATGFARSVALVELLAVIPPLAPLARLLTQILLFFGIWIGASEANGLRGWRSLILPIVRSAVLIISLMLIFLLLQGATFTFDALLRDLGLVR
ncbi:MAG: phage holin family protein [Anaerolineae bacterium]|nr:phage holin family protein [Candidatus Roseilinea sp.]MDW8448915.1 phage holin family protein [Anaerolineae bacterium]